ncbi:B3 DNA binding domain [Dillenia turbinata]|uniref:B3 DNA binding domain n=1 Tax=Dillenia turbinata TaxID=194707 RepID=A0AAN8UP20_9MAGN
MAFTLCHMNLPIGFSRKCSLERTRPMSIVTLTNMEGDSWDIRLICRGSQVSLSQGWGNFVVDNGIEEGDTCIFRFAGPCKLQVYTIGKAEIQQCLSLDFLVLSYCEIFPLYATA